MMNGRQLALVLRERFDLNQEPLSPSNIATLPDDKGFLDFTKNLSTYHWPSQEPMIGGTLVPYGYEFWDIP